MIFNGTILNVCDNSGVKWVQCLKILGKNPRSFGKPGDIIVVSIQSTKSLSKIKKKDIYKAIIVRVKKKYLEKMVLLLVLVKILLFY